MQVTIRKEQFELLPDRCLFWPSQELLVVADCHLGKAEAFQHNGLWLPAGSCRADFTILSTLAQRLAVRQIIFLGDLVHSIDGVTDEVRDNFAQWMKDFGGEVRVVLGNHDVGLAKRWPDAWRIAQLNWSVQIGDFVFQHHPATPPGREDLFYWVGHVHPMIQLHRGPDRVRLPGFVISSFQGLLPAFSTVSGGYDVSYSADDRVFVSGEGRVFEV